MNTITIPKNEYKKMLKKQVELQSQITDLRDFIIETIKKEELKPFAIKRIEKISRSIDKGSGKKFNSIGSLKSYLKCL